jgi:2-amino-4-hydroxy-6-hydroxymethyldihydropteridine diphosphokinase
VKLRKAFRGIQFSSIYSAAAQDYRKQADFLNAAAIFKTTKTPEEVRAVLDKIEQTLKKKPPHRFGPRTIDLDLLLYNDYISLDDALTIPHLRLHCRKFVLDPLIEIGAGDMLHPGFDRKLKSFLPEVRKQDCKKTTRKQL